MAISLFSPCKIVSPSCFSGILKTHLMYPETVVIIEETFLFTVIEHPSKKQPSYFKGWENGQDFNAFRNIAAVGATYISGEIPFVAL